MTNHTRFWYTSRPFPDTTPPGVVNRSRLVNNYIAERRGLVFNAHRLYLSTPDLRVVKKKEAEVDRYLADGAALGLLHIPEAAD